MTVIRLDKLEEFWNKHPDAETALQTWRQTVEAASWKRPTDVIQTFGSADVAVPVKSGKRVAVFNIRGNNYRLIASIDYRSQAVNIRIIMTHAEYDKDKWKQVL
jgi:mRNA interferase HigB